MIEAGLLLGNPMEEPEGGMGIEVEGEEGGYMEGGYGRDKFLEGGVLLPIGAREDGVELRWEIVWVVEVVEGKRGDGREGIEDKEESLWLGVDNGRRISHLWAPVGGEEPIHEYSKG